MSVYRKTFTKPIPPDAIVIDVDGAPHASWKGRNGRTRTARIIDDTNGGPKRVLLSCATYMARYRDGHGQEHDVSTGCRTRDGALRVLADLQRRAELVKAGVMTTAEDVAATHQPSPIDEHIDHYLNHLTLSAEPRHVSNVRAQLMRVVKECRLKTLQDLRADPIVSWLAVRKAEGMGARTSNTYRAALGAFANWCMQTGRLLVHPLLHVPRANEKVDERRKPRAYTEDEMRRLLLVAQLRPVAEYGREREATAADPKRRKRSNWRRLPLTFDTLQQAAERGRLALADNPAFLAELQRTGRERALIYKTLLTTGLRRGELASISIGNSHLDADRPFLFLEARDAKNGEAAQIFLRPELASEIRHFLQAETDRILRAAKHAPTRGPMLGLDPKRRLFVVAKDLSRILDRDLVAAGIPKRDARNRVAHVHAMRHTFGTQLQRAGVSLRTAQAAMRHSTPELTANIYTDVALLDVAGAVDALPSLPLDGLDSSGEDEGAFSADGTSGEPVRDIVVTPAPSRKLALKLALPGGNQGQTVTFPDKIVAPEAPRPDAEKPLICCEITQYSSGVSSDQGEKEVEREMGIEPTTFSLGS